LTFFDGFELGRAEVGDVGLRYRVGGNGPPLLLLHGHPQTHAMWHAVAPVLADVFTVVAADLTGYGESSKPPSDERHERYSKRALALDLVGLMRDFGFERFRVAGHDRGGRVGYRMALDHAGRVERLAVLDIVPTGDMWRRADKEFGLVDWHWFFLAQPSMFPERTIGAAPDEFYFRGDRSRFHPEALDDYLRAVRNPDTVHAMCEDYRAGAGSTTSSTTRTPRPAAASRARSTSCGRAVTSSAAGSTCGRCGAAGARPRSPAVRSTAATSSPRSCPTRPLPSCSRSFAAS
jgi:haloacetate dehalogenase